MKSNKAKKNNLPAQELSEDALEQVLGGVDVVLRNTTGQIEISNNETMIILSSMREQEEF